MGTTLKYRTVRNGALPSGAGEAIGPPNFILPEANLHFLQHQISLESLSLKSQVFIESSHSVPHSMEEDEGMTVFAYRCCLHLCGNLSFNWKRTLVAWE